MHIMKNEQGFTLLEMMIVLLVISVLLIVMVPNVAGHNSTINDKGCNAYRKMVEAQVQAFELDKGYFPSALELQTGGYLTSEQLNCPHGNEVAVDKDGTVSVPADLKDPDET